MKNGKYAHADWSGKSLLSLVCRLHHSSHLLVQVVPLSEAHPPKGTDRGAEQEKSLLGQRSPRGVQTNTAVAGCITHFSTFLQGSTFPEAAGGEADWICFLEELLWKFSPKFALNQITVSFCDYIAFLYRTEEVILIFSLGMKNTAEVYV